MNPGTTGGRFIRAVPTVIVQVAGPGDGDTASTGAGELVRRTRPSWGGGARVKGRTTKRILFIAETPQNLAAPKQQIYRRRKKTIMEHNVKT